MDAPEAKFVQRLKAQAPQGVRIPDNEALKNTLDLFDPKLVDLIINKGSSKIRWEQLHSFFVIHGISQAIQHKIAKAAHIKTGSQILNKNSVNRKVKKFITDKKINHRFDEFIGNGFRKRLAEALRALVEFEAAPEDIEEHLTSILDDYLYTEQAMAEAAGLDSCLDLKDVSNFVETKEVASKNEQQGEFKL